MEAQTADMTVEQYYGHSLSEYSLRLEVADATSFGGPKDILHAHPTKCIKWEMRPYGGANFLLEQFAKDQAALAAGEEPAYRYCTRCALILTSKLDEKRAEHEAWLAWVAAGKPRAGVRRLTDEERAAKEERAEGIAMKPFEVKCAVCHEAKHESRLVDGVCDDCREKAEIAAEPVVKAHTPTPGNPTRAPRKRPAAAASKQASKN